MNLRQLLPIGNDLNPSFLQTQPYLLTSGLIHASNENESYIKLAPEQYVSFLRNSTPKPNFPFRCVFKDSPRWGANKPKPTVGTYVTVGGFVEKVSRAEDGAVLNFDVEAEKVVYLGKALTMPTTSHSKFHEACFRTIALD